MTFVELLMASVIFSLLMAGLAAHLRGGVVAWRRTTETMEELQRVQVTMERLAQDLANATPLHAQPPDLFEAGRIRFSTVRPTAAFPADAPGETAIPAQVRVVTYALEPVSNIPTLVRHAQTLQEALAATPAPSESLLSDVQRLTFRYGRLLSGETPRLAWEEVWNDPAHLPRLVEVTLERKPGAPTPQTIQHIFAIPQGTLTPTE